MGGTWASHTGVYYPIFGASDDITIRLRNFQIDIATCIATRVSREEQDITNQGKSLQAFEAVNILGQEMSFKKIPDFSLHDDLQGCYGRG